MLLYSGIVFFKHKLIESFFLVASVKVTRFSCGNQLDLLSLVGFCHVSVLPNYLKIAESKNKTVDALMFSYVFIL